MYLLYLRFYFKFKRAIIVSIECFVKRIYIHIDITIVSISNYFREQFNHFFSRQFSYDKNSSDLLSQIKWFPKRTKITACLLSERFIIVIIGFDLYEINWISMSDHFQFNLYLQKNKDEHKNLNFSHLILNIKFTRLYWFLASMLIASPIFIICKRLGYFSLLFIYKYKYT